MSKRILCKFFAQGTCLKGEHCQFSHDWRDQSNKVCTFYQKGACSYGSRCRYKHVRVPRPRHQTSFPSSSSSPLSHPQMVSSSSQVTHPSSSSTSRPHMPADSVQVTHTSSGNLESRERSNLSKPSAINKSVWIQKRETHSLPNSSSGHSPASISLADQPICSFAAAGNCPNGEKCQHIHGDLCSICGKHCLHPYRPNEREEHVKMCQENNKRLEALRLSQEIECSVCFDRVLSKPAPSERKFGLLSECDHPFCISCIRKWRSNSPASGMDVDSALRACPICRKPSYFVIPSAIWYSSQEEKQEIIDTYKNKLRSIDCKYFDFGNGACPFGTSCFYRHTYKPYASRPRRHSYRPPRRHVQRDSFMEDAVLMDIFEQLALEEDFDFEDLDYDDFADPLRYMAEEDPEGFLEYALLVNLMNMENHGEPSGDEDEEDEDDDEYEEDEEEDDDEDNEEN